MGHPTLTSEQVKERNERVCARYQSNPGMTKKALAAEFGLNREVVRLIILKDEYQRTRQARLRSKFAGVFTAAK